MPEKQGRKQEDQGSLPAIWEKHLMTGYASVLVLFLTYDRLASSVALPGLIAGGLFWRDARAAVAGCDAPEGRTL